MGEELMADTELMGKLADKLAAEIYKTRWYNYLNDTTPITKCWMVLCVWLKREEEIAWTPR